MLSNSRADADRSAPSLLSEAGAGAEGLYGEGPGVVALDDRGDAEVAERARICSGTRTIGPAPADATVTQHLQPDVADILASKPPRKEKIPTTRPNPRCRIRS